MQPPDSQPAHAAQPEFLAEVFAGWRSQRGLLADVQRTRGFAHAIARSIKPGMTVVDVGSGSGILSFLAARAGAARVHALEATRLIEDSAEIACANGLEDRLNFVRGDALDFRCAEPVDAVIGEWAGLFLFEEWRHFDAFARVRDRLLAAGGLVMPRRVRVSIAPVDDSRLYLERGPGFWERPVWGFDFRLVHQRQLDRTRRIIVRADARTLLASYEILDLDCRVDDARAFLFAREFSTRFDHAATCHGFVGFFDLVLCPDVVVSTAPHALDTHWHQSYFPFEQLAIEAGDTLLTRVQTTADAQTGTPVLGLSVTLVRAGSVIATREHRYTLHDTQG